jgi:hypothetical protein
LFLRVSSAPTAATSVVLGGAFLGMGFFIPRRFVHRLALGPNNTVTIGTYAMFGQRSLTVRRGGCCFFLLGVFVVVVLVFLFVFFFFLFVFLVFCGVFLL